MRVHLQSGPVVIDFTVVASCCPSLRKTRLASLFAEKTSEKERKYLAACEVNGDAFVVAAVTSHGHIGPEFSRLISQICEVGRLDKQREFAAIVAAVIDGSSKALFSAERAKGLVTRSARPARSAAPETFVESLAPWPKQSPLPTAQSPTATTETIAAPSPSPDAVHRHFSTADDSELMAAVGLNGKSLWREHEAIVAGYVSLCVARWPMRGTVDGRALAIPQVLRDLALSWRPPKKTRVREAAREEEQQTPAARSPRRERPRSPTIGSLRSAAQHQQQQQQQHQPQQQHQQQDEGSPSPRDPAASKRAEQERASTQMRPPTRSISNHSVAPSSCSPERPSAPRTLLNKKAALEQATHRQQPF
jgi:hypothetical protein